MCVKLFLQVKLTLQKLAVLASPPHLANKKKNNEDLVKLISGERLHIPQPSFDNLVHGVFYLTLDVNQDSAQAKVSWFCSFVVYRLWKRNTSPHHEERILFYICCIIFFRNLEFLFMLDVFPLSTQEDILYEFGAGSDSKLLEIRGLFTTLTHVLLDVTGKSAKK